MRVAAHAVVAALLSCLCYVTYTIGDSLLKIAADGTSSLVIVAMMAFYAAILSLIGSIVLLKGRFWPLLSSVNPLLQVMRGVFLCVLTMSFIYALTQIPLVKAYILIFMAPFLTLILAHIILGEAMTKGRIIAVILGFSGVLLANVNNLEDVDIIWGWGEWAALFAAMAYASGTIATRFLAGQDRLDTMLVSPLLTRFILMVLIVTVFVDGGDVGLALSQASLHLYAFFAALFFIGGSLIHIILARYHEAQFLAPFHYTQIIWGGFAGWFVFNQSLTVPIMVGGSLIIIAGLLLTYSERRNRALK